MSPRKCDETRKFGIFQTAAAVGEGHCCQSSQSYREGRVFAEGALKAKFSSESVDTESGIGETCVTDGVLPSRTGDSE